MHTFRITDEVVEVRSGMLFRTHRKARLDRIQGINIARPFFARIFGAAKLEISGRGHDANVQLAYLTGANADGLRAEILSGRPASAHVRPGPRRSGRADPDAEGAPPRLASGSGRVARQRIAEFTAPELDPTSPVRSPA